MIENLVIDIAASFELCLENEKGQISQMIENLVIDITPSFKLCLENEGGQISQSIERYRFWLRYTYLLGISIH